MAWFSQWGSFLLGLLRSSRGILFLRCSMRLDRYQGMAIPGLSKIRFFLVFPDSDPIFCPGGGGLTPIIIFSFDGRHLGLFRGAVLIIILDISFSFCTRGPPPGCGW